MTLSIFMSEMISKYKKAFDKKRSCKIFLINGIDTKCDTTYNIDRRYSECQNGINY